MTWSPTRRRFRNYITITCPSGFWRMYREQSYFPLGLLTVTVRQWLEFSLFSFWKYNAQKTRAFLVNLGGMYMQKFAYLLTSSGPLKITSTLVTRCRYVFWDLLAIWDTGIPVLLVLSSAECCAQSSYSKAIHALTELQEYKRVSPWCSAMGRGVDPHRVITTPTQRGLRLQFLQWSSLCPDQLPMGGSGGCWVRVTELLVLGYISAFFAEPVLCYAVGSLVTAHNSGSWCM